MKELNAIEEYNILSQRAVQLTNHSYLSNYVTYPPLDQTSWILVIQLLRQALIKPKDREELVLPALLIQMALNHHEQVSVGEEHDAWLYRKRQLTVLAGDFFSSRYYEQLAIRGRISLIHHFAQAIGSINEAKMELYLKDSWTPDQRHALLWKRDLSLFQVIFKECLPTAQAIKHALILLERLAQVRWDPANEMVQIEEQLQLLQQEAIIHWDDTSDPHGDTETAITQFIQSTLQYINEKMGVDISEGPVSVL